MSEQIKTSADLETAAKALACIDPVMADLYQTSGLPDLRYREPGFNAVMFAIVSQQVSTATAAAIVARLKSQQLTTGDAIKKQLKEN